MKEQIPSVQFTLAPSPDRPKASCKPIGSVRGCPAADTPCKQMTHPCLVLGIELKSARELREQPVALSSGLSVATSVVQREACSLIGEILRTSHVKEKRKKRQVAAFSGLREETESVCVCVCQKGAALPAIAR